MGTCEMKGAGHIPMKLAMTTRRGGGVVLVRRHIDLSLLQIKSV